MILAIETSCDDTCAAVVQRDGAIRANVISSQGIHDRYGGVVPEIAARHHLELVDVAVEDALAQAGAGLDDVELVAVTQGPGLVGALLIGVSEAKALAAARDLPLAPVDHLQGHVAANFLAPDPFEPPFLCLIASGGHTLLAHVTEHDGFDVLGATLDDAAGEAFDKTAQVLGLGYPGGPALAQLADRGRRGRHRLPRPMIASGDLEFSFSGLKTAVLTLVRSAVLDEGTKADVAAEFQEAVVDVLVAKCRAALASTGHRRLVIAGGVGANRRLRERLDAAAATGGFEVFYPELALCTDNGAMIALAGALRLQGSAPRDYAFTVRPRWDLAALPAAG